MRKFIVISLLFVIVLSVALINPSYTDYAIAEENPRAFILVEANSGAMLLNHNEHQKLPIASMVKIMTTLLVIEEIEKGNLTLDETITISERAGGMGGSQMFLDKNVKYSVQDLLKGIIVVSANDACVALAERISGSVEAFVDKMNSKASELNMKNTTFVNCTGLPADNQGSSAYDVSIMSRALMSKAIFNNYSKIWLEQYAHPSGRITELTNTNKLVRFYDGCDGGKTGFTNEAMFCLSAQATRNNVRVVAVVIGAPSSKERFFKVSSLFNYAFANYKSEIILDKDVIGEDSVEVINGKTRKVEVVLDKPLTLFMARNTDRPNFEIIYDHKQAVKAPLVKGDVVGEVYLKVDGKIVDRSLLLASKDVPCAKYGDFINRIIEMW